MRTRTRVVLLYCLVGNGRDGKRSRLDEVEMGPERRDRRRQLHEAGTGRQSGSLVKTGKTYALGIPVDSKMPAYPPRAFKITVVQPGQAGIPGLGPSKTTYNDDIIEGWVGVGSQLDGLGHIGVEHVYYNGNKLADFADPTGLKKLGVEKVPPMVTRGVLLDMAAHFGTDVVKEGTAFNVKEIEEVAKKQGVEIRQGDVVLFHTGWISLIGKDDKRYSRRRARSRRRRRQIPHRQGRGRRRRRHLGARGIAVREQERVRGAPDPAADERHLHPGNHGHRRTRQGQGL